MRLPHALVNKIHAPLFLLYPEPDVAHPQARAEGLCS